MAKSRSPRTASEHAGTHEEPELTDPVRLCDSKGRLLPASVGWSRRPLHTCNLSGHWPRKKKWNYWCVATDKHLFSVTLSDIDYVGVAFAYFLEYATSRFIEQTVLVSLGRGCVLPETPDGDVAFRHKALDLSFTQGGEATRIRVDSPAFGGTTLSADLLVERPKGHETLNVVIPWSRRRFQFTSKQNCLPVTGTVSLGDRTFAFQPGEAFACLDFGRGVWRYATFWNWGSCSGTQNGRSVGLNLGGGWTDGTGMTENAICLDGRISKVSEQLSFSYDQSDLLRPWAIRTRSSDRIDLRFTPFYERIARTNLLVVRSEVHQLFGRYSGAVVADNGERIDLDGMLGWVESHKARW